MLSIVQMPVAWLSNVECVVCFRLWNLLIIPIQLMLCLLEPSPCCKMCSYFAQSLHESDLFCNQQATKFDCTSLLQFPSFICSQSYMFVGSMQDRKNYLHQVRSRRRRLHGGYEDERRCNNAYRCLSRSRHESAPSDMEEMLPAFESGETTEETVWARGGEVLLPPANPRSFSFIEMFRWVIPLCHNQSKLNFCNFLKCILVHMHAGNTQKTPVKI